LPTVTEPADEKAALVAVATTHRRLPVIARDERLWMLDTCNDTVMPVKPTVDVQNCTKFCP
jgi:hypothetical protein